MEFEIDQSRFLAALGLAQTVADKRSNTQPILANVLLRATKDNKLVCSATDMMISVTETIPVEVKTPGALTLGVRYLHNVVRTLPASGQSGTVTADADASRTRKYRACVIGFESSTASDPASRSPLAAATLSRSPKPSATTPPPS